MKYTYITALVAVMLVLHPSTTHADTITEHDIRVLAPQLYITLDSMSTALSRLQVQTSAENAVLISVGERLSESSRRLEHIATVNTRLTPQDTAELNEIEQDVSQIQIETNEIMNQRHQRSEAVVQLTDILRQIVNMMSHIV